MAIVAGLLLALLLAACSRAGNGTTPESSTPTNVVQSTSEAGGTLPNQSETTGEESSSGGTVVSVDPQSSAAGEPGGTIPPIEATLAPLEATIRRLFADSLGGAFPTANGNAGSSEFALLRATTPASMPMTWLVHTTGLRDFDSGTPHRVNIYQQVAEHVVAEVARLNLNEEAYGRDRVGEPDYLGEGSAHQVTIDPNLLFFALEGGIGAHGGVYNLLRFDPADSTLDVVFFTSSDSPGVATERDLNGDGSKEILVDASDAYVFCYACSVRLPQVTLWRWDGREIVQVSLAPLSSDASEEATATNDALLALAAAGLWKQVDEALPGTESLLAANPNADPGGQMAWNLQLLRLNANAKRNAAQDADAPYPLLSHLFYGDYDAALQVVKQVTPEALFATPSALVQGSVAEGWEETLANWIERTTAPAVTLQPDLAAAWFIRGWGDWLVGDIADARVNLLQAATLSPEDEYIAAATELLNASTSLEGARVTALTPVEIRSGPGNSYSILATLQPGQTWRVAGRFGVDPDIWWQIHSEAGQLGWVHASDARLQAHDIDHLPAVVAPAEMAPVALQGRIFFSVESGDAPAIYEIGVGSSSSAALVIEQARQPALHVPTGILAFSSQRPDMLGLGSIDLTTGERSRYTYNLEDSLPRWNVSGDSLYFSSTREGDRRPRVYQVAANNSIAAETIRLGQDADANPVNDRILFKGCDGTGNRCGLWLMEGNGANATALTDNPADSRPRWSPDGNSALFMSDGRDGNWEVYQIRLADGSITRLTDSEGEDGLPIYSASGESMAWVARRDGVWGIYVQPLSSGIPVLIHNLGSDYPNWLDQGMDWAP